MIDADGHLIYVGKSKSLAHRLLSYFPVKSNGEKSARIGRHAHRLIWETAPHELLALLRELELIRRFAPKFNVEGRPEQQRPAFICLTQGPAPFFHVASAPPSNCPAWFGPLRGVSRFRTAVEQLNRRFMLRDCPQKTPMSFAEQRELFISDRKPGCLRYELETCLGPCAALCTHRDYSESVERALAFLRGQDLSALKGLEQAMGSAASKQQFERAVVLRDAWRQMAAIDRSLERLRSLKRDFSFVYELRCRQSQRSWILVRAGHAVAGFPRPSGPRAATEVSRRIREVFSETPSNASPEDLDMLRIVGKWFRQREKEVKFTRAPNEALEYCDALASSMRRPRASLVPTTVRLAAIGDITDA
jgi:excinuclease ABC subunit C